MTLKVALTLFFVVALAGIVMNQCSIPTAEAQGTQYSGDAQRRAVVALESIAASLKSIDRKMK